jgi:hypothetical protein
MKLQKKTLLGILAALLLLLGNYPVLNAQTLTEMYSDTDNSIVFRVEILKTNDSPTKILLVFDSNLITLETTSSKAKIFKSLSNSDRSMNNYNSTLALKSALIVEKEKELAIEDWMLSPFETNANPTVDLVSDQEEEIALENWMLDLNAW